MKNILVTILLTLVAPSLAFGQTVDKKPETQNLVTSPAKVPTGWQARGENPQDYDMYADSMVHHGGNTSGSIRSKESAKEQGFATMMQMVLPDSYRGKRVRLSGYIKSENVSTYAGLWMRVDGAGATSLTIDNMENRPITGTTHWKKYEVVLDVAAEAQALAFGVILQGKGQVWVDDLQLEIVGQDVTSTNLGMSPEDQEEMKKEEEEYKRANRKEYERQIQDYNERMKNLPGRPANLDFED